MRSSKFLLLLIIMGLSAVWVAAQDDNSGSKGKSDTRTITGCLSQSDSGKYMLKGSDGSSWAVRSTSVDLAKHVGHQVSATGVVRDNTAHNLKEDTKDAASDAHMTKSNNEHGRMTVTDLQMVSDNCSGS